MTTSTDGPVDALAGYVGEGLDRLRETSGDAHSRLQRAAQALSGAAPEDFQHVGLLCRDAFIAFGRDIYSPDFAPGGEAVPDDRAELRIRYTLQHFGQLAGSKKLRNLAKHALAYAMRQHHDQAATRDAAQRTLLATTVAPTELARLMETATRNTKWVEKYGVYKCPTCGSTELVEEFFGDFDGGLNALTCTECNSHSEMW